MAIGTHDLDTLEPPFTYEVGGDGEGGGWEVYGKVLGLCRRRWWYKTKLTFVESGFRV